MKTLEQRVADLREFYESGETQSYEFRLEMLKKLRQSLRKHEKEAYPAFVKDYNKNYFETWRTSLPSATPKSTRPSKSSNTG